MYIEFKSQGNPISQSQCTTILPSNISCNIPISGIVEGVYYNLMVLGGDENIINSWVEENSTKVRVLTEDETNELGQKIIIPGSENEQVIEKEIREIIDDELTNYSMENNINLEEGEFVVKREIIEESEDMINNKISYKYYVVKNETVIMVAQPFTVIDGLKWVEKELN